MGAINITTCVVDEAPIASTCINPLVYLMDEAYHKSKQDDTTLLVAITALLNAGIVSSNNTKFCCPNCTTRYGYYYLGNVTRLDVIATTLGQNTITPGCALPCCVNFQGNVTAQNALKNALPVMPTCCDTGFVNAVESLLLSVSSPSTLLNNGIVEVSSIAYETGLWIILAKSIQYLETNDPTELSSFIGELFSLGIAVKCYDCGIVIASGATFNTWLIANNYNDSDCIP